MEWLQSYEDALFPGPKWPTGSEEFFRKPLIHTFKANSLRKIKKKQKKLKQIRIMRSLYFGAQSGPNSPNKTFFRKRTSIILMWVMTAHHFFEKKIAWMRGFSLKKVNTSDITLAHYAKCKGGIYEYMVQLPWIRFFFEKQCNFV